MRSGRQTEGRAIKQNKATLQTGFLPGKVWTMLTKVYNPGERAVMEVSTTRLPCRSFSFNCINTNYLKRTGCGTGGIFLATISRKDP